jgi:hypothetical protein
VDDQAAPCDRAHADSLDELFMERYDAILTRRP